MRLLITNHHARTVGGVETYLRAILPHLMARTASIALLTREGGDPGTEGVPVPGVEWLASAADNPVRLADTAARWRPDVIYTHGLGDTEIEGRLAARFPTVAFMHNYDASCASGSKCHGAPTPTPCARPLGAACLALWWPRRCGGRSPVTMVRMYGEAKRRQSMLRTCHSVLVSSRHMVEELTRAGLDPRRLHHVPLFPTAFSPDVTPPERRAFTGRLLFAGRLTALKGWAHLLAAVPTAAAVLGRPLTLVVAGDGPDRDACEAACLSRHLQSEFLGWVEPSRLAAEMRRADLLLMPSLWPEPFGLIGLEAGCVGLPAVAYAVGGIPEWLTAGVSGELASGTPPTAQGFAEAIVRAVSQADHWQQLRVGAWSTVRRYQAEAHLERLMPVLQAAGLPA